MPGACRGQRGVWLLRTGVVGSDEWPPGCWEPSLSSKCSQLLSRLSSPWYNISCYDIKIFRFIDILAYASTSYLFITQYHSIIWKCCIMFIYFSIKGHLSHFCFYSWCLHFVLGLSVAVYRNTLGFWLWSYTLWPCWTLKQFLSLAESLGFFYL